MHVIVRERGGDSPDWSSVLKKVILFLKHDANGDRCHSGDPGQFGQAHQLVDARINAEILCRNHDEIGGGNQNPVFCQSRHQHFCFHIHIHTGKGQHTFEVDNRCVAGLQVLLGNGTNFRDLDYDNAGRLDRIQINLNGSSSDVIWDYTRNPASQIKSESQSNDAYHFDP